ncbi:MAG: hypothetical protein J0H69_16970 [Burkholderiales bacterium]|nr:hypothetical protein [Burkholderiales bacterium]
MQLNFATYSDGDPVTPSDTTAVSCRALYVGGSGNLVLSADGGATTFTLNAVPIGALFPIDLGNNGRVMAASTATLITALY